MSIFAKKTYRNVGTGNIIGETPINEMPTGSPEELLYSLENIYGSCISLIYIEGVKSPVGWVFHMKVPYTEFTEPLPFSTVNFLLETRVTLYRSAPDEEYKYEYDYYYLPSN